MTPAQYHDLEIEALRCYDRLRAVLPRQAEIVYVVSKSVMEYMENMGPYIGVRAKLGDEVHAEFCGVRIFMAPDGVTWDMLKPAVCGVHYVRGMEVGDLIMLNNNPEQIYLLKRVETFNGKKRWHFTEITETERQYTFEEAQCWTASWWLGTPNKNGTITSEPDLFGNIPVYAGPTYTVGGTIFDQMSEVLRRSIEGGILKNLTASHPTRKPKEEEFGAGDTKLLDDYLHSFMRAGA